ncbi:SpvB/TcaC N-terminal domain-containing protein, partial [uncultured Herbaspirillum sp.]|uniref:SpvB/TcaC N-terminal domain-containing protein n=1 Tax=uncultured Herbaspirillum sp. TaxID=160236 RepID=UPI002583ACAD
MRSRLVKKSLIYRAFSGFVLVAASLLANVVYGQMSTPGQFQVGESGAATYTIPIQLPPGVGGMEPKLSLNYSSQAGNGLLGIGWSLGGLGGISRCPRTMAQDGVRGGVNYDLNDRYCLDGQRLIAVNGTDGGNGTEYRTERESYAKIVSFGSVGNGPAWFKVWSKAGQIMEYGVTDDSRIRFANTSSVRIWALSRVSDTIGNSFQVTYKLDDSGHSYFISRIDYGGNLGKGSAPTSSIIFEYDQIRPDLTPYYDKGVAIRTTNRLVKVKIYANNAPVRNYRLVYQVSSSTQQSLLVSVRECAGDASEGVCLPLTSFSWTGSDISSASAWTALASQDGMPLSQCKLLTVGDVDSDGKSDFICVMDFGGDKTTTFVQISQGSSVTKWLDWGSQGGMPLGLCKLLTVGDVNGDGRPDLICELDDGNGYVRAFVQINQGNSFSRWQQWASQSGMPLGLCKLLTISDTNGDGKSDLNCVMDFGNGSTTSFARFIQGEIPDLLGNIKVESGNETGINYKPLTHTATYTKDTTATYPLQDLQAPIYVVSSVSTANGIGGKLTSAYIYGGLKLEVGGGRGPLGFRWMQIKQLESGLTSYTEYSQDWPYTGLPVLSKKMLANGGNSGVLSQTVTSYGCNDPSASSATACTIAPGKRYFVFTKQSVESSWDYSGTALPVITTSSEYDNWG